MQKFRTRKMTTVMAFVVYVTACASPFWIQNGYGLIGKIGLAWCIAVVLGLAGVLYMFKFEVGDYPYSDTM